MTSTTRTPKQLELDKLVDELRQQEQLIVKAIEHKNRIENSLHAMKINAAQLISKIQSITA